MSTTLAASSTKAKREQFLDQAAVALVGPVPVEVGDGFEGAQPGVIETALERAVGALGFFDFEYPGHPGFVHQGLGVREQAVEAEPAQAAAKLLKVEVGHRCRRCRGVHWGSPR